MENTILKTKLPKTSQEGQYEYLFNLIRSGGDVNACVEDGVNLLGIASEYGDLERVKILLENGANVNKCDKEGNSPLHVASHNGYKNIVQLLLAYTADINLSNCKGIQPIHAAVSNNDHEMVEYLLERDAHADAKDNTGITPLLLASAEGFNTIVDSLLRKGANVDAADNDGTTPLHIACIHGHNLTVNLLLKYRANINYQDKIGKTALHLACEQNRHYIVELLLKEGADVNICDDKKYTPLHIAAINESTYTLINLLHENPNASICDEFGNNPLHSAVDAGKYKIVKLLLLLSKHYMNTRNREGKRPIDLANTLEMKELISYYYGDLENESSFSNTCTMDSEDGMSDYHETSSYTEYSGSTESEEEDNDDMESEFSFQNSGSTESEEEDNDDMESEFSFQNSESSVSDELEIENWDFSLPKSEPRKSENDVPKKDLLVDKLLNLGEKHLNTDELRNFLSGIGNQELFEKSSSEILRRNCDTFGLQFFGDTPRDGNCFFHAVSSQLSRLSIAISSNLLRRKVVEYMLQHRDMKICDENTSLSQFVEGNFDEYCDRMSQTGTFADHVVVLSMAKLLKRDIIIVTSLPNTSPEDNYVRIYANETKDSKDPLLLGHIWEYHYESLQPIDNTNVDSKERKQFVETIKNGLSEVFHANGMIIGCAGAGKTTLLQKLKRMDIQDILKNTKPTRGMEVHVDIFEVKNDTLKVVNRKSGQRHIDVERSHKTEELRKSDIPTPRKQKVVAILEKNPRRTIRRSDVRNESSVKSGFYTEKYISAECEPGNTASYTKNSDCSSDVPESYTNKTVADITKIDAILDSLVKQSRTSPIVSKTISFYDFAGQSDYYACHQIFYNRKSFYLLVIDISKNLDEPADEGTCGNKGTVFYGWTYREYIVFWLKIIHVYCGNEAPVILIGSHAENKTEEDIQAIFTGIVESLQRNEATRCLAKHLDKKRQFSVELYEDTNLDEVKKCICKLLENQLVWHESVPMKWAVFEHFFQTEKTSRKIMSFEELLGIADMLHRQLHLPNTDDIKEMLQFFHDSGIILFFDEDFLRDVIILDVQWLIDVFKCIITDTDHAEKDLDLSRLIYVWGDYKRNGIMKENLFQEIVAQNHIEDAMHFTDELLLFMERLGMIVNITEDSNKSFRSWYVPSVNKTMFPAAKFQRYTPSCALCLKFDFLPEILYFRLIAICVSKLWTVLVDGQYPCLFQNAAVFYYENHNILVGIIENVIFIQILTLDNPLNQDITLEIKKRLFNAVRKLLSEQVFRKIKFSIEYSCKAVLIGGKEIVSWIPKETMTAFQIQCPGCFIEQKHQIIVNDLIYPWHKTPHSIVRITFL